MVTPTGLRRLSFARNLPPGTPLPLACRLSGSITFARVRYGPAAKQQLTLGAESVGLTDSCCCSSAFFVLAIQQPSGNSLRAETF